VSEKRKKGKSNKEQKMRKWMDTRGQQLSHSTRAKYMCTAPWR